MLSGLKLDRRSCHMVDRQDSLHHPTLPGTDLSLAGCVDLVLLLLELQLKQLRSQNRERPLLVLSLRPLLLAEDPVGQCRHSVRKGNTKQ